MAKEWRQTCKDCGEEFGYSDISLQKDFRRGLSRPERCDDCRDKHAKEIKSIASSHFALNPSKNPPSILGYPFLGKIEHGKRELKEYEKEPDQRGIDIGLNEKHIRQIYSALDTYQVLVIVAPTGTGKSTYIPCKLLNPLPPLEKDYFTKKGPIIVTQPRIPATGKIPYTIGEKFCGSSVGPGFDIGFRHGDRSGKRRGEHYDLKRNRLILVTDGSLINWLEEGLTEKFSMIMVDEAHERSCNIDLIIGLLKKELLKYPYLRLIIASATIDADSFVNYFSSTTSVKLDFSDCRKSYGYEEFPWKYSELKQDDLFEDVVEQNKEDSARSLRRYKIDIAHKLAAKVIELINTTSYGGILGFLDGEDNINNAVDKIRKAIKGRKDIKVFPLYSTLGQDKIDEALEEDIRERRVVIATNIAETSLTVPDIVYIVDSGVIKQSEWNSLTCRLELDTKFHSKDGCKQRWGRAGRVQKGDVYKLYSKEEFIKYFPNHTPPEIKRSNSEPIILSAIANGVTDIERFSMLERPSEIELQRSLNVIKKRGIIDGDFDFTEEGREIYRISKAVSSVLDKKEYNSTQRALDVASFLILADRYSCLIEAATAITMMPRMGTALYRDRDGLLKRNKNFNLISKDYLIRLHDSFKAGCIDDLDFACKLFSIYEGYFFNKELSDAFHEGFPNEFSFNLDNFKLVKETRDKLIERFCKGKRTSEYRPLDVRLISRVRILAALAWPDRIVSLKKADKLLFENNENGMNGTISENCAGNWAKEKKAIIGILDQNENELFINGKKERMPVANFLIKISEKLPANNSVEIISSFRRYYDEHSYEKVYYDLFTDITHRIGSLIKVDLNNTLSIKSVANKNFPSENHDELFIEINHQSEEKRMEIKTGFTVQAESNISSGEWGLLENWVGKEDKLIAKIDRFSNYDNEFFNKLKNGDAIEALVKRPIYNIKRNGLRAICGFILKIEQFLYTIPIENLSIELENESIKDLIGQEITLIKTGITTTLKRPIVSLIPMIEKEREELLTLNEVKGVVAKITSQNIYFKVRKEESQLIHLVAIPTKSLEENIRYLEIGGESTLKLKKRIEQIGQVDCLDDDDLSFDKIDELKELLKNISEDNSQLSSFSQYGIQVKNTALIANQTISFHAFSELTHQYPALSNSLRILYAKTWALTGNLTGIKKAFDELYSEIYKMKEQAKRSNYLVTQEKLKEFKWHKIILNQAQQVIIKGETDKIWEITRKRNYLVTLESELRIIPEYQTRNRDSKLLKINDLKNEIKNLEDEIKNL